MIRIYQYGEVASGEIFSRMNPETDVASVVSEIIADVAANGDRALYEYTERFDRAVLKSLTVSREEIAEAAASADPEFLRILE